MNELVAEFGNTIDVLKQVGKGSFSRAWLCRRKHVDFMEIDKEDELFVVKEISINQLKQKYNKTRKKPVGLGVLCNATMNPTITPYTQPVFLARQDVVDEEEQYYHTKVCELIECEAEVLYILNHPHIIQIHGCHKGKQVYLMSLEYCCLGDVYHLLKSTQSTALDMLSTRGVYGGLGIECIYTFIQHIASALVYVHGHGFIHRDIKLHNVLIDKKDNAVVFKLTDFGFCCYARDDSESDIHTVLKKHYHKICGTPQYMAPELLLYNPEVKYTFAVDMWSFGICIYQMVFNELLVEATKMEELQSFYTQPDVQEIIYRKISRQGVDPMLCGLLCKLLILDPSQRAHAANVVEYMQQQESKHLEVSSIPITPAPTLESEHGMQTMQTMQTSSSWEYVQQLHSVEYLKDIVADNGFFAWLTDKCVSKK